MMRSFTWIIALTMVVGSVWAVRASALTLIKDGRSVSVIVTSDQPYPSQSLAAEELQYHLRRITGVTVPIVKENDLQDIVAKPVMLIDEDAPSPMMHQVPQGEAKTLILVGQSKRLTELGIDTTDLDRESLIVRTVDGALVLAGEDGGTADPHGAAYDDSRVHTGTLYAVYDFLQDELGCRWIWPGESGEVIPRRSVVEVGDLDVREQSPIFRRNFRTGYKESIRQYVADHAPRYMAARGELFLQMRDEERLWRKRMRLGQRVDFDFGHSFTDWWEKYQKQYPEIFALQPDGHRGLPTPTYRKDFVKLCVSNPKVVELKLQEFLDARATDPSVWLVHARPNDGGLGWCTCENCRAWDRPLDEEVRRVYRELGWTDEQIEEAFALQADGLPGSLSYRYLRFWNELGKRLAQVAPDAYVVTYGYSRYTTVPIGMHAEPNILVGFHELQFYPLSEAEHHMEISQFLAWKHMGMDKLFWRPNCLIFGPALGIPWHNAQMAQDMELLADEGVSATDFDSLTGHWSTAPLAYYGLVRQQWDTDTTADRVAKEFYDTFGPAADAVREYLEHWDEVWTDAYTGVQTEQVLAEVEPIGGRLARRKAVGVFLSQEDFNKARAKLVSARQKAEEGDDPALLQRIHILELGFEHGELMWRACQLQNQTNDAEPIDYTERWPIVKQVYDLREELANLHAHNVFFLMFWETTMHDPHGVRVYQDFAGRSWRPLITPAAADWLFLPDPGDEGEQAGWAEGELDRLPSLQGSRFDHLFFRPWSNDYLPIKRWRSETGATDLNHAWYQVRFTAAAIPEDIQAGDALYIPLIVGKHAKVWINDGLVRDIGEEEIASQRPVVIPLDELSNEVRDDGSFRLTIKVSSPDSAGGMIGPAYIARPTNAPQ